MDGRCSIQGCWYCNNHCHSCFGPATIGYALRANNGALVQHCSERCYHMYTRDFANGTVLDTYVGEVPSQPTNGNYLLLSGTVILHTRLSKNTVTSTQLAIMFNNKDIPSGVVCVYISHRTTDICCPPTAWFIGHDLTPIKVVHKMRALPPDIIQEWKEKEVIKKRIQPLLDGLGFKDLPSFLHQKFPSLKVKFMDTDEKMYLMTPTGTG